MGGVMLTRCVHQVVTYVGEAQHNSIVHEAIQYVSENVSCILFQGQFHLRILYFAPNWNLA